jgi:hypothetical protein
MLIIWTDIGVITFFRTIFPGSRRKKFVQERKNRHSQPGCVQVTPGDGLSSLVFQSKPFLSAFEVVQTSIRKHFFFGNAAEVICFSSCLDTVLFVKGYIFSLARNRR